MPFKLQGTECFDSNDVMSYILGVCQEKGYSWNVTKAQKLLYCCYGAILAGFGCRLTEEAPQAWQYGPVFPRTIKAIKRGVVFPKMDNTFSQNCPKEWLSLLQQTICYFGRYSATQLVKWTHRPDSPWSLATNNGKDLLVQIPATLIHAYFSRFVKNGTTASGV